LPCPLGKTLKLAGVATRLKQIDTLQQERLINWDLRCGTRECEGVWTPRCRLRPDFRIRHPASDKGRADLLRLRLCGERVPARSLETLFE
jgi:hypothetical protein